MSKVAITDYTFPDLSIETQILEAAGLEVISGQCKTQQDLIMLTANADYVINLLPLNDETDQIFTQKVFEKMKFSAFFINIGRGETVDEDALISALKNQKDYPNHR